MNLEMTASARGDDVRNFVPKICMANPTRVEKSHRSIALDLTQVWLDLDCLLWKI